MLGLKFGGRPYPVNEPEKDCGTPTPPGPDPVEPVPVPVPVPVPWQDGTRQQVGSFGSATKVQVTGTLVYFGHLKSKSRNEPPRGKTNNVVSEQVRHKPGCTSTEDG